MQTGIIIEKEHIRANSGTREVENRIKRAYIFPNITRKFKSFINNLQTCNIQKYDK